MKLQTKLKYVGIRIFLLIFLIGSLLPFVYAEKELVIGVNIIPRGVISTEYNVVGDVFSYNISLFNNDSEVLKDNFTIEIMAPINRSIAFGSQQSIFSEGGIQIISLPPIYNIELEGYHSTDLIPYISKSEKSDVSIFPFDVAGDYQLKVCSSSTDLIFKKIYHSKQSNIAYLSYIYFPHCFIYSFSAMPEWQYKLFTKEKDAADKSEQANQKLLDLNTDLDQATKSILKASWLMFAVALIALYITASDETEKRKWRNHFIRETILSSLAPIILLALFIGFVVISYQLFGWIGFAASLILCIIFYFIDKKRTSKTET